MDRDLMIGMEEIVVDCQHPPYVGAIVCLSLSLALLVGVTPSRSLAESNSDATQTIDHIVVALDEFQLLAKKDGELVEAYPIATGADTGPTPTGEFTVINKLKNPWYTPDDEPAQKPGPDNPLGTRWIGIDKPSYGLHGTKAPNSIGTRASEGCIRLFNNHVEELYQMVEKGTKVTIRESLAQSDRQLVAGALETGESES